MFERSGLAQLLKRCKEPQPRFVQVLTGPRQVGKTTLACQLIKKLAFPSHLASADAPEAHSPMWLAQQWETGRLLASRKGGKALLVIDEIQKIPSWSSMVKKLRDEDQRAQTRLHVLILGSSTLLPHQGLQESLTGRFELQHLTHWSFPEMSKAFGLSCEEFIFFGGYPGAAHLRNDLDRWRRYILHSFIEPTISRDILMLERIHKPALLRALFFLGCRYSGQKLSYQKMLGQLQDAGNTTTLSHYLTLLQSAGMLQGLEKYAPQLIRQRSSSPKLQVLNTAFLGATCHETLTQAQANREWWGRAVESAVGAHLAAEAYGCGAELFYWRDRNLEVDFVVRRGEKVLAIEVKSGRGKECHPGLEALSRVTGNVRPLLVGGDGIPIAEFLQTPLSALL